MVCPTCVGSRVETWADYAWPTNVAAGRMLATADHLASHTGARVVAPRSVSARISARRRCWKRWTLSSASSGSSVCLSLEVDTSVMAARQATTARCRHPSGPLPPPKQDRAFRTTDARPVPCDEPLELALELHSPD